MPSISHQGKLIVFRNYLMLEILTKRYGIKALYVKKNSLKRNQKNEKQVGKGLEEQANFR